MEKVNDKGKSGIKEERLKALRGNYKKPSLSGLVGQDNKILDCSDMASPACPAGGSCSAT